MTRLDQRANNALQLQTVTVDPRSFALGFKQGIMAIYKLCKPEELVEGMDYWIDYDSWVQGTYIENNLGKYFDTGKEVILLTEELSIRGPVLKPNEVLG